MKIYVVGSSKNKFLPLDNIREKFLIDQPHEGDNIDFLNPWYCELTGLYYLWKHVDDEIVGLEHYRRYFVNDAGNLLSENEINKILNNNDVIVCNKNLVEQKCLLKDALLERIKECDLNFFLNNIDSFLKDCFTYYLKNARYKCPYNMLICKKHVLNDWASFIFSNINVLLKNKIFTSENLRFTGFISEFLLYGFLLTRKYKIYKNNIRFIK